MDPRIPAGVAVMFNPLAAGLSWASSVPGTKAGDRVVILGAGQRGLCCVIAARVTGARQVVITGPSRDAQKLAPRASSAPTPPSTSSARTSWRACAR
jgi:threonine dehydrogenase-like Zn-dependent dehydrogenase